MPSKPVLVLMMLSARAGPDGVVDTKVKYAFLIINWSINVETARFISPEKPAS